MIRLSGINSGSLSSSTRQSPGRHCTHNKQHWRAQLFNVFPFDWLLRFHKNWLFLKLSSMSGVGSVCLKMPQIRKVQIMMTYCGASSLMNPSIQTMLSTLIVSTTVTSTFQWSALSALSQQQCPAKGRHNQKGFIPCLRHFSIFHD